MNIRTVAIVGAGTMGLGIAQVCASAGLETQLFDVDQVQVDRALATIQANLTAALEKGKLTLQQKEETLAKLKPAYLLSEIKADLIVEAIVERLDVKQKLFAELEAINKSEVILATNTSSISVSRIASVLKNPGRCIGWHFFNPADRMKLVEIICGKETDPALVGVLMELSKRLGKNAVVAKDSPGFIVNRVARPYYVESIKLLEEGVADVTAIDRLMRSAGFKMGPFELMDLIGVDTNLAVTTSVYEGFGKATRFAPSRTQQQLVAQGRLGKKSGKGFYDYSK